MASFFQSIPEVVRGLLKHDTTTRAASVELWVVVPAVLVLLQFAVGSLGPQFAIARQINPGVQLLRILSYYSVSYTLGLMKPSVSKVSSAATANDFFQVWAVLIVTMQESARIGRPYRPKEMTLVDLLASLWAANQLRASTALYLKVPLWVIWSIHASRIIWYYVASNGAAVASVDNMKLVSDYMAALRQPPHPNPATMAGYEYLVLGEDRQVKKITPGFTFHLEKKWPDKLVTLDKVWRSGGDSLLGAADDDNRFKDVCLSFALYKLLRRRFFDFPIPEANDVAMRRLVAEAILHEKKDYERAFRVTEVELSFLQDFSYSKHAMVFASGFPAHRLLLSLSMMAAALYLSYAVRDISSTSTAVTTTGKVARITHGVGVTRFLIFIVVFREIWEICVYVLSQWTKVLIICHYIRINLVQRQHVDADLPDLSEDDDEDEEAGGADSVGQDRWMPRLYNCMVATLARIMFWIIRRGRWDEKIQQNNLLLTAQAKTQGKRSIRLRSVDLQPEVKKKIFESLKALIRESQESQGNVGSSESWIQARSNHVLKNYLQNAFAGSVPVPPSIDDIHGRLEGETHKILAWHVATSICQIKLLEKDGGRISELCGLPPSSPPRAEDLVLPHYLTAVTLSNYCVHMVAEALVPDTGLVAGKVLEAVRDELRVALRRCDCCGTRKEVCHRLEAEAWRATSSSSDGGDAGASIVKYGARLAVELMSTYEESDAVCWEILAKFWARYLLYLSASTTAAKHRIHLQGRGELTTHLWALLSHAGFLGENAHGQQLLDPDVLKDA